MPQRRVTPEKKAKTPPVFGSYILKIRFTDGVRVEERFTLPMKQAIKLRKHIDKLLKEAETEREKYALTSG